MGLQGRTGPTSIKKAKWLAAHEQLESGREAVIESGVPFEPLLAPYPLDLAALPLPYLAVRATMRRNAGAARVYQQQHHQQDADEESEEEDENENGPQCLGITTVSVVGLQYYNGIVSDKEMVLLTREPNNAYDRFAIRVDNAAHQQIGHVERYKACHLSPLLDAGLIRVEGLIPRGSKNMYKMPCHVMVYATAEDASQVRRALSAGGMVLTPCEGSAGAAGGAGPGVSGSTSVAEQEAALESLFESLAQGEEKNLTMEQPAGVTTALYPHQLTALCWMLLRENSNRLPPFWETKKARGTADITYKNSLTNFTTVRRPAAVRGGLLADDMGLGKTLTAIALIATNCAGAALLQMTQLPHDDTAGEPPAKRRKGKDGKATAAPGGKGKAKVGEAPEDVPPATPPPATGPRSTLIVCPLSVMSKWANQIQEHAGGQLSVYQYYGSERVRDATFLDNFDVVITTYSTLASEGSSSPLQRVQWLRCILDEAHVVKNPSAKQTKAVLALSAYARWALTGTPIQNRLADLYSIIAFLKLEPLSDKSFWNRVVERPIKAGDPRGLPRLRALLTNCALRRTKETRANGRPIVDLPRKTIAVQAVELSPEERALYERVELQGRQLVSGFLQAGTLMHNYAAILCLITRLRQICDHTSLCPAHAVEFLAAPAQGAAPAPSPELVAKLIGILREGGEDDCPICLCPPTAAVITRCAHVFCRRCIEMSLVRDKAQCPLCRAAVAPADLLEAPPEDDAAADQPGPAPPPAVAPSAKVTALLDCLRAARAAEPGVKSVVFSQFTKMLTLLEEPLTRAGFAFVRLDGSMSARQREAAMEAFKQKGPRSPAVFLLSLKAAGVGLNLVAASHVYLMDPWWNPATEEQAHDRVHRLGQTRDVHVTRFVVTDSIEERILELQERKRALATAAFSHQTSAQQRQTRENDVRLLMRL
ncbi:putative SNF2 family N-terminal domain containing protein [Klebsormidium nitens]|uniref:Putative SNF2 family N-terminal domain containing protein n=1 Tax=Klebsormidium nitens TaxID=105231 RepID=A0A0U9HTF4_KLENI|nr:putative SNF2 family N-terminal domain containing protein [Klebsormidium nitens]|eukprot:GAQ86429.1 putative SNF2 family N-terminal domain containing protein [Klebsormidium nitens]